MTVRSEKYPPELREWAVRWSPRYEVVRKRVRRAQVDAGARLGVTGEESEQMKRLKRENFELHRANEILKAASLSSRRSSTAHRDACEVDRVHRQSFGVVPICTVPPVPG